MSETKLTPQIEFCLRLAQETTMPISDIIRHCGISKSTAYKYLKDHLGNDYAKQRSLQISQGKLKDKLTPEVIREIEQSMPAREPASAAALPAPAEYHQFEVVQIPHPHEQSAASLSSQLPDYNEVFNQQNGRHIKRVETLNHGSLTGRAADIYEFCGSLYAKYHRLPSKSRIQAMFQELTGVFVNNYSLIKGVEIWAVEHGIPVQTRRRADSTGTVLLQTDHFNRISTASPSSSGVLKININGIELQVSGNQAEAAQFVAQVINQLGG